MPIYKGDSVIDLFDEMFPETDRWDAEDIEVESDEVEADPLDALDFDDFDDEDE